MEKPQGIPVIWFDTIGRIPIRVGIPAELTAPEAKATLEEFVVFLAKLAALPHADKMTFWEMQERPSEKSYKPN